MRETSRRGMLAMGAAGVLAACQRPLLTPSHGAPLHAQRLADGFPALSSRALPGVFQLGVMSLDTTSLWCSDRAGAYPLDAAVALPTAVAAMAKVELGELTLDQRVAFNSDELSPPPSDIDAWWPEPPDERAASIALAELFRLTLAGDNTAIDLLMKTVGGPGGVNGYVQAHQQPGVIIDRYRREAVSDLYALPPFRPAWKDEAAIDASRAAVAPADRLAAMRTFVHDPRDAATVPGALNFLASLSDQELISDTGMARLTHWMGAGADLGFRAGLPDKARLAQVSGAAARDQGVAPASASLAIATWPDGSRYALVCFLTLATADDAARHALFADAAALAAQAIG